MIESQRERGRRSAGLGESADFRELQLGEHPLPSARESVGLSRRYGHEEFVILSVRESAFGVTASCLRERRGVDFEAAPAGGGESWQVGGETVTQIHHGTYGAMPAQPAAFHYTRCEVEVLAFNRATQRACDEKQISGFAAGSGEQSAGLDPAGEGYGYRSLFGPGGFSTDNTYAEFFRGFPEAFVKFLPVRNLGVRRSENGDKGVERLAAHGSNIADRTAKSFPADAGGLVLRQVMDALHYTIGLQKKKITRARGLHHGAVVPGTGEDIAALREIDQDFLKETILGEIAEGYFIRSGHANAAATVIELKVACMMIGAQSDLVFS